MKQPTNRGCWIQPLVAGLVVTCGGCADESRDAPWRIDERYSHALLHPTLINGSPFHDEALTVDSVQIFRTGDPREFLPTISEVRARPLIWQTADRKEIDQLFAVAREEIDIGDCSAGRATTKYIILAFDGDLQRVAYFSYYPCVTGDAGALVPSGNASIVRSSALAPLVERDRDRPAAQP